VRADRPPAPARAELSLAALLGALALVLVWRIGEPPAANPAEARVQGAVASIVSDGDWLVPQVDGAPRIEKPPGYAWQAAEGRRTVVQLSPPASSERAAASQA